MAIEFRAEEEPGGDSPCVVAEDHENQRSSSDREAMGLEAKGKRNISRKRAIGSSSKNFLRDTWTRNQRTSCNDQDLPFRCAAEIYFVSERQRRVCILDVRPQHRTLEVRFPNSSEKTREIALRNDEVSLEVVPGMRNGLRLQRYDSSLGDDETPLETMNILFSDGYHLARVLFTISISIQPSTSLRGLIFLLNACVQGDTANASATLPTSSLPFFELHMREIESFFPNQAKGYLLQSKLVN